LWELRAKADRSGFRTRDEKEGAMTDKRFSDENLPEEERAEIERELDEPSIPDDAPEADALEQSRPWGRDQAEERPRLDVDVPEADAYEQSRPAYEDEDEDYR
jgi:hypothetical protein